MSIECFVRGSIIIELKNDTFYSLVDNEKYEHLNNFLMDSRLKGIRTEYIAANKILVTYPYGFEMNSFYEEKSYFLDIFANLNMNNCLIYGSLALMSPNQSKVWRWNFDGECYDELEPEAVDKKEILDKDYVCEFAVGHVGVNEKSTYEIFLELFDYMEEIFNEEQFDNEYEFWNVGLAIDEKPLNKFLELIEKHNEIVTSLNCTFEAKDYVELEYDATDGKGIIYKLLKADDLLDPIDIMEKANIDKYDKIDNIEFDISSKKLMLLKGAISFCYEKINYEFYSEFAEKAYYKFSEEEYEDGFGVFCEYFAIDNSTEVLNLFNKVLNQISIISSAKFDFLYGDKIVKIICRNNGEIEIYRSKFNL